MLAAIFFATMVIAALLMDLAFNGLGLVPSPNPDVRAQVETFSFNYTFYLNLAFGALAAGLAYVNHTHPMQHHSHDRKA